MIITNLKVNRITNPLGFDLGKPHFSFITGDTDAKTQSAARIEVAFDHYFDLIIFDSGKNEKIDSLSFELPIELLPYTRYYWRVTVWADNGETATSDTAWFETAKLEEDWQAKWITPSFDQEIHPVITKEFISSKKIISARAYICGLGLYELYVNGKKAGDEYLTPNFNAYNKWIQYQTYDLTGSIKNGDNTVEVLLGNGQYKGVFSPSLTKNLYGDQFALLCEIVLIYADGTVERIITDNSWKAKKSKIQASGIYSGEVYDATFVDSEIYEVNEVNLGYDRLMARKSLPVVIKEKLQPIEVITTPAGETVLDMGQNLVGWVEFKTNAPKGAEILFQHGEILQEGNFYRENLEKALAEYRYISNGEETWVRPHFTYYGFRYVKITGWQGELSSENFIGCVLYSDMELTGHIETSDPLVNRLFLNALWGQKGNFVDVPTDCPQRSERLGWTGDAQVFSGTANFNMDTYAFYSKYNYDIWQEQKDRGGCVPYVVPVVGFENAGSSAWGDAATVIPWNAYLYYGDKAILEQQFDSMKAWVDFIKKADEESGAKRLWSTGFHFGDWLALDGDDPVVAVGATDVVFISSAYYYYSSMLVAKAAKVLNLDNLAAEYEKLAQEVKTAIQEEYFTKNGRLALNTQTAYILALYMELVPEGFRSRIENSLRIQLKKDKSHLKTGFVGTPYICRVLSESGSNDMAYTLLLNKDYPSWLFAVTMGATTIWERWNSVLPDGKINPIGMNSLNHYSYGSIVEWMYRNMLGINPVEGQPGFRHIKLAPQPDMSLQYAKGSFCSAVGLYESQWTILENGDLNFKFHIPFHASASLTLPNALLEKVSVNGMVFEESGLSATQDKEMLQVELYSGSWEFTYTPSKEYVERYSSNTPMGVFFANPEVMEIIKEVVPLVNVLPAEFWTNMRDKSFRDINEAKLLYFDEVALDELDKKLISVKLI